VGALVTKWSAIRQQRVSCQDSLSAAFQNYAHVLCRRKHSISLSPLWERGGVRGTVRLATLVAPSPAPSPIQGEGKKMSVTVFEKRSTKG